MEKRILKIDEDTKLDRLDKVLAEELDFSRKRIKDLLDEGNVLVNQKVMKASYKVCVGDEIEVSIPELDSTQVLPEPIDLDIMILLSLINQRVWLFIRHQDIIQGH